MIMIPVTIAALEKLKLTGITEPAINMLHEIMNMIPNVLIGVALILAGIWLGKVIGGFVHNYLQKLGFDRLTSKMNIGSKEASAKFTTTALAGDIITVFIILLLTLYAM